MRLRDANRLRLVRSEVVSELVLEIPSILLLEKNSRKVDWGLGSFEFLHDAGNAFA